MLPDCSAAEKLSEDFSDFSLVLLTLYGVRRIVIYMGYGKLSENSDNESMVRVTSGFCDNFPKLLIF